MPSASASALSVLAAALAALVVVSTGATSAQGGSGRVVVQPSQTLAILLGSHGAMSAPDQSSTALELVRAKRPITEDIGHTSGADGGGWLQVLLPGRPNGHTGWITLRATRAARTSWHIVINTTARRVTIYYKGRSVRVFKAVVGKPATPTPRGEFFVEEVIQLRAGDVGAPYALALSARSNVLQEFAGGPGQIALHGLRNVGGVLGTAASHGCVRLANDAMRWLNIRIGPGVPVTIKS